MTRFGIGVLSGLCLITGSIVACSGSSTSFNDAKGGAGSGGSGASSGNGSGGSGATGGSATGGSAGKGTGGSGTGGSSAGNGGTSGDGAGGNAGDATGGTGGTGTGGSAGMAGGGGTGAMTGYHPPPEQVDACTSTCQKAADANCDNGDSLATCITDCRTAIRVEACSDAWDTLFACQAMDTVECNGDGQPTFPDCVDEYALAIACVYDTAIGGDLEPPCSDYCNAQADVMCDNSTNSADCTQECQLVGTIVEACDTEYVVYLDCAKDADFTCNADGDPFANACAADYLRFLACVVTEYDIQL